ncbi:uncharacterized protein LOC109722447 [Ananas comosus]|uniref:Uncharacterized protein LOC109722447 n=1 Tax=Ananas comosus TaxID=4615 RepID=A0A6P5GJ62_ANACO|nr:uncharacterized protein LOC109722447 [Ananas comosus]
MGDLGIREPPPLQIGSAVIPQPPADSRRVAPPRQPPTTAPTPKLLTRPPRPVRRRVARSASSAAAAPGVSQLRFSFGPAAGSRSHPGPTPPGRAPAAAGQPLHPRARPRIGSRSAAPPAHTLGRPSTCPDPSDVPAPFPGPEAPARPHAGGPTLAPCTPGTATY